MSYYSNFLGRNLSPKELLCFRAVLLHKKWKTSLYHWGQLEKAGLVKRVLYTSAAQHASVYRLLIPEDQCRAILAVEVLEDAGKEVPWMPF